MLLRMLMFVLVFVTLVSSRSVPSYIKQCSISDPDVTNCILKNGNDAIPHVATGEKIFGIPNLKPLIIPEVTIETDLVKMKANDVTIIGMETARLGYVKGNLTEGVANISINFNYINISSDFVMKANFLVFNIDGKGPVKIDMKKPTFFCDMTWDLEEKNGKDFIVFKTMECNSTMQRIYFDLYKFFEGNDELGATTTVNLNASWRVIHKELGPVLMETVISLLKDVLNNIVKNLAYHEIFVP